MSWKKQRKRLNRFYRTYGKFEIASRTSYGIWRYFTYPSLTATQLLKEEGITDRRIMKDEVVIETDMQMRKMNYGVSMMHEKKLLKHNIAYERWWSGNKSYHTQVHFPELMMVNDAADLKLLKRLFMLWMYDFDEDKASKHKLDLQLSGNHLIKMEYSKHHSTGNTKRLYSENISDKDNVLPISVWVTYTRMKRMPKRDMRKVKMSRMKCMLYFLDNKLNDCRKRVMFVLLNNLRDEFGMKKAIEMIRDWNDMHNNHISDVDMDWMINYHAKTKYTPKCKYIRDVLRELNMVKLCKSCVYR